MLSLFCKMSLPGTWWFSPSYLKLNALVLWLQRSGAYLHVLRLVTSETADVFVAYSYFEGIFYFLLLLLLFTSVVLRTHVLIVHVRTSHDYCCVYEEFISLGCTSRTITRAVRAFMWYYKNSIVHKVPIA